MFHTCTFSFYNHYACGICSVLHKFQNKSCKYMQGKNQQILRSCFILWALCSHSALCLSEPLWSAHTHERSELVPLRYYFVFTIPVLLCTLVMLVNVFFRLQYKKIFITFIILNAYSWKYSCEFASCQWTSWFSFAEGISKNVSSIPAKLSVLRSLKNWLHASFRIF